MEASQTQEVMVKVLVGHSLMATVRREQGNLILEVPQKVFDFVNTVKEGESLELSPTTLLSGGASLVNSFFRRK